MHGYDTPEQLLDAAADGSREVILDASHINNWARILNKQDIVRGAEVEVTTRDGSRKWVLVNIRAARNRDGVLLYHEGTVEDITERKRAQQQVNYLAYYDVLTGLPNRTLLQERLKEALSDWHQNRRTALLFLDLDRFKLINDSLGHSFGDLLLRQVADRLQAQLRKQDTVARVGGDEFLILLPGIDTIAEAESTAARLVSSLTGEFQIQGRQLSVSCSVGISIFPEHGRDEETLIRNADAAMYSAKEKGCNTFCLFTEEMNTRVMERLIIETSLRGAVERKELFSRLPAAGRYLEQRSAWFGGASSLAAPGTRSHRAGSVHRRRRKYRPDHVNWRMGAARDLPANHSLAEQRAADRSGCCQRLCCAVSPGGLP